MVYYTSMKLARKYFGSLFLILALFGTPLAAFAQLSPQERAQLESDLAKLEAEIAAKQKELDSQKANSASLSRDVSVLTGEINKAKLEIEAKNKILKQLGGQIGEKVKVIDTLNAKQSSQEQSLSQILRKKNQIDDTTLAEFMLSNSTLSGFLGEVDNLQSINQGILESFYHIKITRAQTAAEKAALEDKKNKENDVKYQLENQKKQVETKQVEKTQLLTVSKGQEKNYEDAIKARQAEAAKIRARLFELRGQNGIQFGDAVVYAQKAAKKTGVRPAFILAILTQESNLGKNVGSCLLTNPDTGAGIGVNSGTAVANVMKPGRDVGPFMDITKALGRDPFKTRVSCPIGGSGYGGAMGPSQFIASTWNLFKSRIATALGVSMADPWNPEHAVMATAMYVGDLGAGAQTYTAEKDAACKYYSGRSCTASTSFYGNSVMNIAIKLQKDIDFLGGN